MNIHIKVSVSSDDTDDVTAADMGFELDPIAVQVSDLLSRCTYDFDGTNTAEAIAYLICEHSDELFETVSEISKACKDNFNGSTNEFKSYLVSKITENEIIH